MSPPGRRSGPRHESRLNVDIATDVLRVALLDDLGVDRHQYGGAR